MQTLPSTAPSYGVRPDRFTLAPVQPEPLERPDRPVRQETPAPPDSSAAHSPAASQSLPADRVASTPPAAPGDSTDASGGTNAPVPPDGGAQTAPVRTRPEHPSTRLPTLTAPVERLDTAYLEPFSYFGRPGEFPAALSVIQIQRAFNRLAARIEAEAPELIAEYMGDDYAADNDGLLPLTVDGLMGPNTNRARQLLLAFAGVEPDARHMRASDWDALSGALERTRLTPWFTIAVYRGDLNEEEMNAAMIFERLTVDDPKRAAALAERLGVSLEPAITREDVTALVEAMAAIGVPLTTDNVARLYTRDPSGLGGVTTMRALNAVDLLTETEELDYDAMDEVIDEAIEWIRDEETFTFLRFARVASGGDEEAAARKLHALIKAVMSAESDLDRVTDEDVQDVGLMQLIPAVVSDYRTYFDRAAEEDEARAREGLEPRRSRPPSAELPPAYHPSTLHPVANTAAGGALLMRHYANFGGDVSWASAAYNKGPNHPDIKDRVRIPNVYSAHIHTVRTQRRALYYLEN